MSIVGVYKEIQDQHMNIVSISKEKNNYKINSFEFIHDIHTMIFTVESFLCGFVGAVGNESRTRYEGRAGNMSKLDSHFIITHIRIHILWTNKLFQINFKQLFFNLVRFSPLHLYHPAYKLIELFWNFVLLNLFFLCFFPLFLSLSHFRFNSWMCLFMWPHNA